LDEDRFFILNRGELKLRLDPLYFKAIKQLENNIIRKSKYPILSVKDVCSIKRGKFTHRPRNDPKLYNGNYPFIQTGDIVKSAASGNKITYTQTLNERGKLTSRLVYPPQLLMTIAANIGATAILDFACCYPDSIVAIKPKHEKFSININYLNVYFNLIQSYVEQLAPFSAQRNLNNQQLGDVPLIIPTEYVQQEVMEHYANAIENRKSKEKKAEELLASIDEYLISELGIELPQEPENTIENRRFKTNWSTVIGKRIDPDYYSERYQSMLNAISNSSFKTVPLSAITKQILNGKTPSSNSYSQEKTYYPIIKAGSYTGHYVDLSKVTYSKYPLSRFVKKGDIFILSAAHQAQYVGRHIKLLKDIPKIPTSYVGELIGIRPNQKQVLPYFLFALLSTELFKTLINREKTGQTSHVYPSDIRKIQIPKPNLEIQKEMELEIISRYEQANELNKSAELEFQQAKKEIEKLILNSK